MGRKERIIDFGKYGKMTVKEAAEKYGIQPGVVYARASKGINKEKLIDGTRKLKKYNCGRYGWLTVNEISEMTGLKKSTAYRRAKGSAFNLEAIIDGNYFGNIPKDVPDRHKYDCGKYGHLTSSEIAKITGMPKAAIRQRVSVMGYKLEEIVDGKANEIVDFGKYGKMTVKEASNKFGILYETLSKRISAGKQKEDLLIKVGSNYKKYDCGKYGKLMMKEIMSIVSVSRDTIYTRIYAGYQKEEIIDGRRKYAHKDKD